MKRDLAIVAVLMLLSSLVQAWCIGVAVTPSQDTVRFVGMARAIQDQGLLATMRETGEPPLYPALISLLHGILEPVHNGAANSWAVAAQLASAAALILCLWPLYFALRRVTVIQAAIVGCLLFCVMGEVARLGADGLSDSTHLLMFCIGLWACLRFLTPAECKNQDAKEITTRSVSEGAPQFFPRLRFGLRYVLRGSSFRPNPLWLIPAGLALGVAVMARREALVLLPALALTAVIMQLFDRWRVSWLRLSGAIVCLLVGMAAVWTPWMSAAGRDTLPAMTACVLGRQPPDIELATEADKPVRWRMQPGSRRMRMSFTRKDPNISLRARGYLSGLEQFADESMEAFGPVVGLLTLVGLWLRRKRSLDPATLIMYCLCGVFILLVLYMTARVGYLSPRHLLPLVVVCLAWAGEGMKIVGTAVIDGMLLAGWSRAARLLGGPPRVPYPLLPLTAALVLCAAPTLRPAHASRSAHRQAGMYLAQTNLPQGEVIDTRGFTGLYSGRTTHLFENAGDPLRQGHVVYLVLERHELNHDSQRSRTLSALLKAGSRNIVTFPASRPEKDVLVCQWSPERFAARLTESKLAN